MRALQEIQRALNLAPNDPKVQEIAARISYFFPDGMKLNGSTYDYPWLTAIPPPPTPGDETIIATETPPPTWQSLQPRRRSLRLLAAETNPNPVHPSRSAVEH